jgi:hypothetical protein
MRSDALARETRYRQGLVQENDRRRHNRFRKHSQHSIFCGYTNGYAKEGPGQKVFLGNDKQNNKTWKRRTDAGSWVFVGAAQIDFRSGYSQDTARAQAEERYNQARALENLERSGGMSRSEAVMAARHPNAWKSALAVAKYKHIYVGDEAEPILQEDIDAQAAGLQDFEEYKRVYACADLQPEAVSHALSFYRGAYLDFPVGWSEDDHLDFFVFRYAELMTHPEGVLAGTIEAINYNCDEHIDAIVRIASDVMASPRLANFQQHIINHRNHEQVEYLSFIARVDALPHVYLRDDHNAAAFLESTSTRDTLDTWGLLNDAETEKQNFVSQPSWAPPTDFTHWDTWIPLFFEDRADIPQIPYHCVPRVAAGDLPFDIEHAQETEIVEVKLRQIERMFSRWRKDAVVFLVLELVRKAAGQLDYEGMCSLAREVKIMMLGDNHVDDDDDEIDDNIELDEEDEVVLEEDEEDG